MSICLFMSWTTMFTKKTTFLPYFMDGFVDGSALRFLEVLKDSRSLRISAFLVIELGVSPLLFGALGLSVKEAKIWTISVCPLRAAQ